MLWARDFLSEIGYRQTGSTRIYEDNNGCIGQSTATKGLRRARHYLIALAALNEACHAGDIHLFRVDSDKNVADSFTKGLGGEKHTRFGSQSLGRDITYLYKSRKQMITTDDEQTVQLSINVRNMEPDAQIISKEREQVAQITSNEGEQTAQNTSKEGELYAQDDGKDATSYHPKRGLNAQITSKEGELIARDDDNDIVPYHPNDTTNTDMGDDFTMETYLRKAAHYAETGHEPKFHMFLKLAKFVGHRPRSTAPDSQVKSA